ncbi:PD40 domain-containing protein [candidate division WOR-3 bacterium]|nr:PD40 domain-containing protein [candidate division WOR-3 bacterium]
MNIPLIPNYTPKLFTFIFLLISCLFSQPYDPNLNWKTLETEHFSIHYHQDEDSVAFETGKISEDVYIKVVDFLEWNPKGKTNIVIVDNQDLVSGFANPFPINTIYISPAQPPPEEDYYEDWLRELITHEFTHIVQLDRTAGFPAFLRKVFGRAIINNSAQPIWFIEGIAVYSESKFTNGGRLNSPYFSMILREDVNSGNFKSIDRASNFPRIWPGSITPYVYGSSFIEWIIKKYGKRSIIEYNYHTSNGFPFAVNRAARRVFGKDFLTLWREWKDALESNNYTKTKTKTKTLTSDGEWNLSPTFSPDSKHIAFIHRSYDEYPGIEILNTETGERKKIVEGYINPGITWSKDGKKILFSKLDVQSNYYYFSQIYEYNIQSKKLSKIEKTERGNYPVYTQDEKGILFIKEHTGSNDICIIYPQEDSFVVLLHNDDHTQYHYPQFSSDGRKVLLSVWKKGEGVQIYVFDFEQKKFEKITKYGNNTKPIWSVKLKGIYFVSDRSGIYEPYFYSLNDKKIYAVTEIKSGIFYPDVSKDGKEIVFSLYTPNGYNIHTITVEKERFIEFKINKLENKKIAFIEREIKPNVHPYNPLPYLIPRFWLPMIIIKEERVSPGFLTFSQDVLYEHEFYLKGAYFIPEKDILYYFSYINNCFRPQIFLEISQDFKFSRNRWVKKKEKNIYLTLSKKYTTSLHAFTAGYEREVYSTTDSIYKYSDIMLGYSFSNRLKFPRSIEYERGGYLTSTYRLYSTMLQGDDSFHYLKTKMGYYFRGPFKHDVISIKSSFGFIFQDTQNIEIAIGGNSGTFSLRGYESGIYTGQSVFTGSCEYSFPLFQIERGIRTYPIYFNNFHAKIFSDFGSASLEFPSDNSKPLLFSFGIETTLSLDLIYSQVPCNLTGGIAFTKDEAKPKFYFNIATDIPYFSRKNHLSPYCYRTDEASNLKTL